MYIYKLGVYYGLLAINDAITLGGFVNLIFIAVINESRIYHKALCFLYSSK